MSFHINPVYVAVFVLLTSIELFLFLSLKSILKKNAEKPLEEVAKQVQLRVSVATLLPIAVLIILIMINFL